MKIRFYKYHALGNDFILIENMSNKITARKLPTLAKSICNRRTGIGADGLLYLSKRKKGVTKIDVYNADGGWAEKSGNGLRIAGLHEYRKNKKTDKFKFEMGGSLSEVRLTKLTKNGGHLITELGVAEFDTKKVPVKNKSLFMINAPLRVGGVTFPVTCLSVGNPHAVLFVDDFDFDWIELGAAIETHPNFPNGTNVEFVKVITRKRLQVADWERGAGATGSSGTGAAAAVSVSVLLGLIDRKCRVEFETGTLLIVIRKNDNVIELSGPAVFACQGIYEYQ